MGVSPGAARGGEVQNCSSSPQYNSPFFTGEGNSNTGQSSP